jgi:alpha-galactosidase
LTLVLVGCQSSNSTGGAGGAVSGSGGSGTGGATPGSGGAGAGGAGVGGRGAGGTGAGGAIADAGVDRPDARPPMDASPGVDTAVDAGPTVVGATPPMGWNSWNTFQCAISETLIKGIADVMVSSGMQAAGYQYVNIDDCWMNGRDSSGRLQVNTTKFPAGMAALASYIHGKGLKFGMYESPNTSKTCVGLYCNCSDAPGAVGSGGHETIDAQTFASWGVDYLKYDHCAAAGLGGFATMRDALRATGRPIFYSINPGDGSGCPPNTCSINLLTIANMWRIGFDINASWSSMIGLVDMDANLSSYAGPGHWNDPDMLEVGKGLTADEDRTHFSMWAMLAAPLIAGNDIRSMSATTNTILTNTEVIAVDQDPLGKQGQIAATPATNLQVWSKPLAGTNTRAVALLNRGTAAASITVQWTNIGIPAGSATVRDLWQHTDLGNFNNSYTAATVPAHGVVMLKITSAP